MLALHDWVLGKLEPVQERRRVIVRDRLRLVSDTGGPVHQFAQEHGFTAIVASTNLVFRDLYERCAADPTVKKILVVDRAAPRRVGAAAQAAPPFYPDIMAETLVAARIDLDLQDFLKDATDDELWPALANDPRYARLIVRNLPGVLTAHANLRKASEGRFTDHDFLQIVVYASLGIPEAAFRKLESEQLWRIGLAGHTALPDVTGLAPELVASIRSDLRKAPAPFAWFADRDPETVLRASYLSLILSQHVDDWQPLLANLDPALHGLAIGNIDREAVAKAVADLVRITGPKADEDLRAVEDSLSADALSFLHDRLKLGTLEGAAAAIARERYSTLIRGMALVVALDDLLVNAHSGTHYKLSGVIAPASATESPYRGFVEQRRNEAVADLTEAYRLAVEIQKRRLMLTSFIKSLKVKKLEQLDFESFWEEWNGSKEEQKSGESLNRIEYYLSMLERLVEYATLLPRLAAELPAEYAARVDRIRQRVRDLSKEVNAQLDQVNARFQEMVVRRYPEWVKTDGPVRLTSQFIRRTLKPHWDPQTEHAVVLVFDGMRYDLWAELLRPVLLDRMDVLEEYPASSMLPSETEVSRWALAAGTEPASFWPRRAENFHLTEALKREFGLELNAEPVAPDSSGMGETVRYRAGNLDYVIFEFCDKELHGIRVKTLADGRQVPSRTLAYVYREKLKSLIDTEVVSIVKKLAPGTKVFVTADHGFARVARDRVPIELDWLNEPKDCLHLNAWLRKPLPHDKKGEKVRERVWEMSVADLRMPAKETATDKNTNGKWEKTYASIIFPKTGYALARPGAPFDPDAYTHGGISMQELMIPMLVLRVKNQDQGPLGMEPVVGPGEFAEGQEVEFVVRLQRLATDQLPLEELRVELEATLNPEHGGAAGGIETRRILREVLYLPASGLEVPIRVRVAHSDIGPGERRGNVEAVRRTLTVTASTRTGLRVSRRSETRQLTVRLNSEQVIRRVGNLGNILGLTPKTLR